MKFVILFTVCFIFVVLEPVSSHSSHDDVNQATKPFETLIRSEIHEILENFFKYIKELIGNVTHGEGSTTSTEMTPTYEPEVEE